MEGEATAEGVKEVEEASKRESSGQAHLEGQGTRDISILKEPVARSMLNEQEVQLKSTNLRALPKAAQGGYGGGGGLGGGLGGGGDGGGGEGGGGLSHE